MSKDEFLKALDKKLQVINESERRDIIDEYRTHIEMKIQGGKSEEEAVEDFGDIDELVDEILDAYKINTSRVHQSFDRKFNNFMDDLYEGFKRFIGSFTSLEVDDVVRLIFEVLVILLILGVLHIPFSIISHIGASLLRGVMGFGIGSVLATIWKTVIEIAYVVLFIVVIVNVVSKRVTRYRNPDYEDKSTVFDDFKDSFNFNIAKDHAYFYSDAKHKSTSKQQKEEQAYEKDATEDERKKEDTEEGYNEQVEVNEDRYKRKNNEGYETSDDRRYQRGRTQVEDSVSGVVRTLMKVFFCLLMIPFISIIVVLSCALGAMVVLSFEGFTLYGAYFLVIGSLCVIGSFLSLLHRVLWRRG